MSGLRFTLRARREVPGLKLGGHRLQLQKQAGGGLHRGLSVTSRSWKYECELNPEYVEARKENRVEIRETEMPKQGMPGGLGQRSERLLFSGRAFEPHVGHRNSLNKT